MHALSRKLSKRRRHSRQKTTGIVSISHTKLLEGRDASPSPAPSQSRPESLPGSTTPSTFKTPFSSATPKSIQTHDGIPHASSPCSSIIEASLFPTHYLGRETDSTTSIHSSIEPASRRSSRFLPAPTHAASSVPGSSPAIRPCTRTSAESQPPWDRSVEIFWSRHVPPGRADADDEAAFRENLARLREMATRKPGPSPADTLAEAPADNSILQRETTEVRIIHVKTASQDPQTRYKYLLNASTRYFRLPNHIRFKIIKYVLASHDLHSKPIRMNSPVFLSEVWPVNTPQKPHLWSAEHFDSLKTVLSTLKPYTSVCSAMRADVLATLFLTRRFHIVYSPYVARELQPAATHYMDRYGPFMAFITLEVDFTKLGGGWQPEAANLRSEEGLRRVKQLLERFTASQLTRHSTAIQDLRILVRRYHGNRPQPTSPQPSKHRTKRKSLQSTITTPTTTTTPTTVAIITTDTEPPQPTTDSKPQGTPYTPDPLVQTTLSPLKSLGPIVQALTITGAPESVATELIASLWGSSRVLLAGDKEQIARHVTRRFPAREWILMEGQRAVVDFGPGSTFGVEEDGGVREGKVGGESGDRGGGLRVIVGGVDSHDGRRGWKDGNGLRVVKLKNRDVEGKLEGSGEGCVDDDDEKEEEGFWSKKRDRDRRRLKRLSAGLKGVLALRGTEKEVDEEGGKAKGMTEAHREDVIEAVEVENAVEDVPVQKSPKAERVVSWGRKGLFGHY